MNIMVVANLGGWERDFYGEAFVKGFESLGHNVDRILHTDVGKMNNAHGYDFMFHSYHSIPMECVDRMRSNNITTVLYVYDEPFEFPKTSKESPHYDISFNGTYRYNIKDHNALGANMYFLPQAVDTSVYHPVDVTSAERGIFGADISFIGTLDSRRKDRTNLEELFHGFNYKIWGPGTTGWVGPDTCNKIYSCSKIIFNPPAAASLDPTNDSINMVVGEHTCRVYNTAAANAFQIVSHRNNSWKPYIDGEEIVSYRSIDDIRNLFEYYLSNDEERVRISNNGYLRTLRDHTFINRAQAVLNHVELFKRGALPTCRY